MTARYVSADSHVTEPIELFAERVDARFRDRVPRIVEADGWRTLHMEGADPRKLMTTDQLMVTEIGGPDVDHRRREQENDGVHAELIFPTFALQSCFCADDPELQTALTRAYNDWAWDVFGAHQDRNAPVGLVAMLDVEAAVAEARRLAGMGFKALFLPAQVESRPYNDPAYEPFWAVANELGLPLTFHSGTGHEPRVVRGPGGAVINYLLGAQLDGPRVMLALAASGVLDRFENLRVVTVETGAAWLAWIMTQADEIYEAHSIWARPKLSLAPSELIARQCAATFMHDPVAIHNRHITGLGTLMWGNDYPHPEGTWPRSSEAVEEQFREVPADERDRLLTSNAASWFGFEVP